MPQRPRLVLVLVPVLSACNGGDGTIPLPACDPATEACATLSLSWSIESGDVACGEIAATAVVVTVTSPAGEISRSSFSCGAGAGLSATLPLGPYTVAATLESATHEAVAVATADNIVLARAGQVLQHALDFRIDDGLTRLAEVCDDLARAICDARQGCGYDDYACEDDFVYACCAAQGRCDERSEFSTDEVASCAARVDDLTCDDLDAAFDEYARLSFCDDPPPAELDARDLGRTCTQATPCADPRYACFVTTGDVGYCSLPCQDEDDFASCENGYPGPGVPFCTLHGGGEFYCAVACGQYNDGDDSCPGLMTCEDGYDGDIDPDLCEPPA